jgi:serine/threonine-protein kinase
VDSQSGLETAVREVLADRYAIERELGRGGMATVYVAHDTRLDRRVAIKVMLPDVSASVGAERFLREVHVAAQLNHPHILGLHDSGRVPVGGASDLLYYVMPYVEGESLRDRLRRDGPLAVTDALRLASEVADALAYAHARGIVHRDIKPENILLSAHAPADRDRWHAVVADFGIARILAEGGPGLTSTGVSIGTPAYMSPEQASGERSVDTRTDIYSLGCVLYETLVGEPPFTGPNAAAIVARHLTAPVPSIRTVRPAIPIEIEAVVNRALEKLPVDRFGDAATFKASIDRARDVDSTNRRSSGRAAAPALSGSIPTRRWAMMGAASALLALGGYLAVARAGPFRTAPALAGAGAATTLDPRRVAVIPLRVTGDSSDAYLADAWTDDMVSALSRIGALRVVARSSIPPQDDKHRLPSDVARAVQAGSVVEQTYRHRGDSVAFDVSLVDANTGEQLWGERYVRRARDLAGVQDSIASAVARRLERTPGAPVVDTATKASLTPVNGAAYDAYLRGTYLTRLADRQQGSRALDDSAIAYFDRAIELDPRFALPHTAIAAVLNSRYFIFDANPAWEERAFVEIEKALALDPNLAEAYQQKGVLIWTKTNGFPHEAAVRLHKKAAALKPSFVDPHGALGAIYMHVGLLDRALAEFDTALTLDPTTTYAPPRVARIHWYQGNYAQALREFEAFDARIPAAFAEERAVVLDYLGRSAEALALLDSADRLHPNSSADAAAARAIIFAGKGNRAAALGAIATAERDGGKQSHFHHAEYSIAVAYALLGDNDKALEYLRRTSADGMPCYPLFRGDPHLRGLAKDPRFVQFMAETKRRWEELATTL